VISGGSVFDRISSGPNHALILTAADGVKMRRGRKIAFEIAGLLDIPASG